MEIVPFREKDQKATAAFMRIIYDEMGWGDHPADGLDDLGNFFHIPEGGVLFLIKEKYKVVGTGGFVKLTADDLLLKRFFIAKEIRGSGIAQKLLAVLLSEAGKCHCSRIVIDVSRNNSRAIRFYEKNGFKQYHQSPIDGWSESSKDWYNYYYLNI